ncbi:MAG TPA: mechanosensitive ion channel family protein [Firmicutes bacterium]|nr:mechanosensitive ion channel family protein [Bacillota bacterium]HOQ24431.1 mechanosensitive ion channel family protein [Bacillota bacterium]HPT68116.1 mechanosensitive ion channel family protein [Bacillota bacterium]
MHQFFVWTLNFNKIWQDTFFNNAFFSLVVLVVAVLFQRIVQAFIKRVFRNRQLSGHFLNERRAITLTAILSSVARFVIYFFALLAILEKFKVPVTSFLTAAGIGGVALAFGAQNLVRDVITGFFIIFEDQYAVGDYVTVAGVTGTVEEMTLRVTKIRDRGGKLHIIPNGKIDQVTNFMGNSMQGLVDVTVAHETDLALVERVLADVFAAFSREFPDVVEGPTFLGVQDLGAGGVTLRIEVRTKAQRQWSAERLLRKMIKMAFEEKGIEIPYPKRVMIAPVKGSDTE